MSLLISKGKDVCVTCFVIVVIIGHVLGIMLVLTIICIDFK